jgi:phage FluMu protein Com
MPDKLVKCPRCGNDESFSIVFDYLRVDVKRKDGKYVGKWGESELSTVCCEKCGKELGIDEAETVYENFYLKGDEIPEDWRLTR